MNRIITVFIHLIFWLSYGIFSGIASFGLATDFDFFKEYLPVYIYNFIWAMVLFYTFYVWVHRYFSRQHIATYAILSVVISLSISGLFYYALSQWYKETELTTMITYTGPAIGSFIIGQCGCLVRGFLEWFKNQGKQTELERLALKNEVLALKAQLNPHFLFNTLNNIDSLIFSNQDKASASLIKLSQILRYLTYESNKPTVHLEKELELTRNIVELYQLRFTDPNYCELTITGNPHGKEIPPLLFLAFTENAFKHSKDRGKRPAIRIEFAISDTEIQFTSSNDYMVANKETGIGLQNSNRRLNLLYGDKHKLEIDPHKNVYSVKLTIPIHKK